jgi:phosphoenolpyruvate carboxykinase (ATP)
MDFNMDRLNLNGYTFRPSKIYRNLPVDTLIDESLKRREGILASNEALTVYTGKYTGRSPEDKFIVYDEVTKDTVDWGNVNKPFAEEHFDRLCNKIAEFLDNKEVFVFDGYVGADPSARIRLRVITDTVWQSLFSRNLFIRASEDELSNFKPDFIVASITKFFADPTEDNTRSEVFIVLNFKSRITLIGGTSYAGEIKKAVFTAMNFYLPEKGILPMHCAANVGSDGDVALFFGLSGTGKTSLSADTTRFLIGDDEHGWSSDGIFNFEGGCYAKCINLNKEKEPQIWNAIRYGAIMENVVLDENGNPEYSNASITENTRVAYPLEYMPNAVIPSIGPHPKVILFLTADAFGVLPPIARLTKEGAMYHFLSGYTSKLAGTERGITKPKETFSVCFAAPFMPRKAVLYANMLGERIDKYGTRTYLINTGWIGGPYGVGERIKIEYSRAIVRAAISGEIDDSSFTHDDIFNLDIPLSCPNVPSEILIPRNTWQERDAYDIAAKRLARLFVENFKRFNDVPDEIIKAGPRFVE